MEFQIYVIILAVIALIVGIITLARPIIFISGLLMLVYGIMSGNWPILAVGVTLMIGSFIKDSHNIKNMVGGAFQKVKDSVGEKSLKGNDHLEKIMGHLAP